MSKKKDNGKKKHSRKNGIVVVGDTLYISFIRSNVLTSVLSGEDINSLLMYSKKGKVKELEALKDKTVHFKLHTSYELRDKNGVKVEPEVVNKDTGFATYKIKMKSFINTIKADIIEKDLLARKYYNEESDKDKNVDVKAYHAVSTTSKSKEPEKLYVWSLTQIVGEVRNKKKKKVCDIRFDL